MSKTLERYVKRFEPHDLKCASGYTWRVRRMQAEDWGAVAGGLLTLPTEKKNGSSPDSDPEADQRTAIKSQAAYRSAVYEHLVLGLVDEETGEVTKPTYDHVDAADMNEIMSWQFSGDFNSTETAQVAGRSLQ